MPTAALRARPRWPGEFTVAIARSPLALFRRLATQGDAVVFRAAGRTFVVVAHPDLAREVLVTGQKRFARGYAHRSLRLLLGDGLLTSEGDFHRRQRRIANPAFHRERIAAYAVAMSAAAERWSDRWTALAARAPRDGPVVDVSAEMTALTLGIAGETLFGTDVADRASVVADAMRDAMRVAPLVFLPFARWATRLPLPVVGGFRSARAPTFDDLPRLPYARAVLAESMRLYPPAYAVGRICVERCTLGGVDVQPGWGVVTSPWLAHHDPRWWPEPERFRPERWSEPAPERPKLAYFPFGGGSRICIGEQFAWTEATLVLATLARRWTMRLVPGQDVRPLSRITLRQSPGARVRLIARAS